MKLLNESQLPLISTSANPAGSNPATSADTLMEYFNAKIDIVIDAGQRKDSIGSTIIDLSKGRVKIMRKGAIASSQIFNKIKASHE